MITDVIDVSDAPCASKLRVAQAFNKSTKNYQLWTNHWIGYLTDMTAGQHGYRYVLTIIDSYSRYTVFYPLKTKRAEEVVKSLRSSMAAFGTPRAICCDNGGEFRAAMFQDFCQKHHILVHYTTPYHPQGNAQTERQHRSLKMVLTALCKGHPLR